MSFLSKLFGPFAEKPNDTTNDAYLVGRDGTIKDIIAGSHKVDGDDSFFFLNEVVMGARCAFKSGRPDNLQDFFAEDIRGKYSNGALLLHVMKGLSPDDIKSTVSKMTADERALALNDALIMAATRVHTPGDTSETSKEERKYIGFLIAAGADPNANEGEALRRAACTLRLENVKALIDNGASINDAIKHTRAKKLSGEDQGNTLEHLILYKEEYAAALVPPRHNRVTGPSAHG